VTKNIWINSLGALLDPNDESIKFVGTGTVPPVMSQRVIDDIRAANVSAVNITVGHVFGELESYEVTMREIKEWDKIVHEHSSDFIKVHVAADIVKASCESKIGVIFGFQNSMMFGDDESRVDEFASLGVKVMQLTYNDMNKLGGGSLSDATIGLTEFGRATVAAMNRSRTIVDLSHSNVMTCVDAVKASTQPVAITHTGCRAVVDVPRNKSDAELRLVAENGGYIGIYLMPFLASGRSATGDDVIAHIEHALDVCGADHVGVGTDTSFTPVDDIESFKETWAELITSRREKGISAPGESPDIFPFVVDMLGTEQMRLIAHRLAKRGHSDDVIDKVMGLNFLRFSHEVWGQ
jgi:membrane dipeptidase